jgi:hypothetical protein
LYRKILDSEQGTTISNDQGPFLAHKIGEEPRSGSGACSCSDPMPALDPVLSSYKKMAVGFNVRRTFFPLERRQERAPEAPFKISED